MADKDNVLEKAVEAALEAEDKKTSGETEETKETKSEKKEETKEEAKDEELSEEELEEIRQGRQLLQALKDPEKAPIVIDFLIKQSGYKVEPKTEKQVEKQKDSIIAILEEEFGEDFAFLAPKMAKGLERILDREFNSRLSEVRQRQEQTDRAIYETEAATAIDEIREKYFPEDTSIPANVEKEMSKLMDRYPPSKGMTTEEYLNDIMSMVAGKLDLRPASKVKQERTDKNSSNAPSRLASQRGGSKPSEGKELPKKMTLEESVKAAMAEAEASIK